MFRFFATLLVTGVALLAASAWWSGRDASDPWSALAPKPEETAPPVAAPEPPAERAPESHVERAPAPYAQPAPALQTEPAPAPKAEGAPAKPARPLPAIAALSAPAAEPRRLPPIPAPPLTDLAERDALARAAVPEPTLPEPIPAPFAAPPSVDEIEETRIPEPAPFLDEIVELAEADRYGEENVVYVEGDDRPFGDSVDALFADRDPEPFEGELGGERAVTMSASADRIRRLLDVYESLEGPR